jgi:hypothetical protein
MAKPIAEGAAEARSGEGRQGAQGGAACRGLNPLRRCRFGDTGTRQLDYGVPQFRNAFQNIRPTFLSTIPDWINLTA